MKLHYEKATDTIRDSKNHCVMSFRTFATGGTFDAALLPQKEQMIRLIAAAPELLAACRSALAEIAHCQVTNYAHATLDAAEETLRAAITKATGGN